MIILFVSFCCFFAATCCLNRMADRILGPLFRLVPTVCVYQAGGVSWLALKRCMESDEYEYYLTMILYQDLSSAMFKVHVVWFSKWNRRDSSHSRPLWHRLGEALFSIALVANLKAVRHSESLPSLDDGSDGTTCRGHPWGSHGCHEGGTRSEQCLKWFKHVQAGTPSMDNAGLKLISIWYILIQCNLKWPEVSLHLESILTLTKLYLEAVGGKDVPHVSLKPFAYEWAGTETSMLPCFQNFNCRTVAEQSTVGSRWQFGSRDAWRSVEQFQGNKEHSQCIPPWLKVWTSWPSLPMRTAPTFHHIKDQVCLAWFPDSGVIAKSWEHSQECHILRICWSQKSGIDGQTWNHQDLENRFRVWLWSAVRCTRLAALWGWEYRRVEGEDLLKRQYDFARDFRISGFWSISPGTITIRLLAADCELILAFLPVDGVRMDDPWADEDSGAPVSRPHQFQSQLLGLVVCQGLISKGPRFKTWSFVHLFHLGWTLEWQWIHSSQGISVANYLHRILVQDLHTGLSPFFAGFLRSHVLLRQSICSIQPDHYSDSCSCFFQGGDQHLMNWWVEFSKVLAARSGTEKYFGKLRSQMPQGPQGRFQQLLGLKRMRATGHKGRPKNCRSRSLWPVETSWNIGVCRLS